MNQPTVSSSSKVKVQYFDPHNVFACISPDLEGRLPLKSLNWNSPGRPARLIDTLVIELEPAEGEKRPQSSDVVTNDASGRPRSQSHTIRNRDSDGAGTRKERRHQIPGLRQTPYLKVLLLRCDDTDTYKSTTRKEIREWIKAHTPPSQKSSKASNQENHDAFEWMILHVVLPDVDRRVTWPHRNSIKILGYLRDDFNSSSKNAVDRIAQVPSTRMSATDEGKASATDPTFSKQADDAWDASLRTVKQLILSSFDQRVRQYEDDIKEKRAQRSLPGWNFCTFFVLKEGLSRGFESVGLVEDALSGYDELHAELDSTIRSKHGGDGASQDATIFRDSTPEVAALMKEGLSGAQKLSLSLFDKQVIDATKKPYRDLILSSDISIFDFKTYIFAREITFLQRLGTAERSSSTGKKTIEPRFLCDICQRATSFIGSAGIILRDDVLAAASGSETIRKEDANAIHSLMLQIVSGWTHAVASSILELMDTHPAASSRPPSAQMSGTGSANHTQAEAASHAHFRSLLSSRRAAVTLIARRALQHLGSELGWNSGWEAAAEQLEASEQGQDVNDATDQSPGSVDDAFIDSSSSTKGLKRVLSSSAAFQAALAGLTQAALRRHQEAGDLRSARSLRVDLGLLKFGKREYAECADMLSETLAQRLDHAWAGSQVALLSVLAHCYKELKRDDDYVRVCLRLIADLAPTGSIGSGPILQQGQGTSKLLKSAINTSRSMSTPLTAKLEDFISSVKFDQHIQHEDDQPGFSLQLSFQSHSLSGIHMDKLGVSLARADSDDLFDIEMYSRNGFEAQEMGARVTAYSDTICSGLFKIKKMSLDIGNIHLVHEFDGTNKVRTGRAPFAKNIPLLRLWIPATSPTFQLDVFEQVDLDQAKALVLTIDHGSGTPRDIQVHLRAASAGLRLHTAQAKVIQGGCAISDTSKPGIVELGEFTTEGTVRLTVPFQMDFELKAITVKCELSHSSSQGQQRLGKTATLPVILPLGVNVQDVFKEKTLFSKFSISSSSGIPLRVTDYELNASSGYQTSCPAKSRDGFPVFGKQPACLTYMIRRVSNSKPPGGQQGRLRLSVTYKCLDEEILHATKHSIRLSLDSVALQRYRYFLEEHISAKMKTRFSHAELESVALLREVNMPSYSDMEWDNALSALPTDACTELSLWLRNWHEEHQVVALASSTDELGSRKIDIPVDVPPMHVVHTAKLKIINLNSMIAWHVGDAIPAELKIRLTTQWSREDESKRSPLTFNYELDATPDTWIIGGQRRGLFSLEQGRELSFPVLLLPQRAGYLMLPGLDMRIVNNDGAAGGSQAQCEVDYRSQGESLLVIPAMDMPTVGLNVHGERRSWLIDAS